MNLPPEFVRGSHEQARADLRIFLSLARATAAPPDHPVWLDIAVLRYRTLTSPSVN